MSDINDFGDFDPDEVPVDDATYDGRTEISPYDSTFMESLSPEYSPNHEGEDGTGAFDRPLDLPIDDIFYIGAELEADLDLPDLAWAGSVSASSVDHGLHDLIAAAPASQEELDGLVADVFQRLGLPQL